MTACEAMSGWKRLDAAWCVLVFLILGSIYLGSRETQAIDSNYSLLLSETLLERGTFELDYPADEVLLQSAYQIDRRVPGKLYYLYPPGSPVLSLPMMAVARSLGWTVFNERGRFSYERESRLEQVFASIITAATGALLFVLGRQFLTTLWSVVLALAMGVGTQMYSTNSRGLWSDTWGGLLLAVVLWMLLARREKQPPWWLMGTLLGWLYITRPTYSVHIALIGIYLLIEHRTMVWRVAVVAMIWLGVFMVWTWSIYGALQPAYYRRAGGPAWHLLTENLGVWLVSPSRGLLTMVPLTIWIVAMLLWFWKRLPEQRFMMLSAAVVVAHIFLISAYQTEFGGHSYGSRLTASLVPWIAVLTAAGMSVLLRSRFRAGWLLTGAVFLGASFFVQWRGATAPATWSWNYYPVDICRTPEHGWNWRYPQWIAGLVDVPMYLPKTFPAWQGAGRLRFDRPEVEPYLAYHWSVAEEGYRWNKGRKPVLIFSGSSGEPGGIRMKLSSLGSQRIGLELNGVKLTDIAAADWETRVIEFPPGSVREKNVLRFWLPEARRPDGGHGEERELGLCVAWMEFVSGAETEGTTR